MLEIMDRVNLNINPLFALFDKEIQSDMKKCLRRKANYTMKNGKRVMDSIQFVPKPANSQVALKITQFLKKRVFDGILTPSYDKIYFINHLHEHFEENHSVDNLVWNEQDRNVWNFEKIQKRMLNHTTKFDFYSFNPNDIDDLVFVEAMSLAFKIREVEPITRQFENGVYNDHGIGCVINSMETIIKNLKIKNENGLPHVTTRIHYRLYLFHLIAQSVKQQMSFFIPSVTTQTELFLDF